MFTDPDSLLNRLNVAFLAHASQITHCTMESQRMPGDGSTRGGPGWLRVAETRPEPQLCPALAGRTSGESLSLVHFGETWTIPAPSSQGWHGEDMR